MTTTLITNTAALAPIARRIHKARVVAIDIETTALRPFDGRIRLLQLKCDDDDEIAVIDCDFVDISCIITALKGSAVKVAHNAKFEQAWLSYHHGLDLWPLFDTWRASVLVYNGQETRHGLYDVMERELRVRPHSQDMQRSNWGSSALTREQLDYAAEDVMWLGDLYRELRDKLKQRGLLNVARLEFDVIKAEAACETRGVYLDRDRWMNLYRENVTSAKTLRANLQAQLPALTLSLPGFGSSLDVDSPKQVLASLRLLGLDVEDTRELTLAQISHPAITALLDYREVAKCVSSFGEAFLQNISSRTGRIHTSYYPFTGAGRYASSDPNLQQIPRAHAYRDCFRAAPGKRLVLADYAAIEMRICAEIAGDAELIRVFTDGKDAHRFVAAFVAEKAEAEVTKTERQAAKAVNFGLIYGMQPEKLALYAKSNYGVDMSLAQAERSRSRYFALFPRIEQWHAQAQADFRKHGNVRTLSGRLRYLPQDAFNEVYNTPVQGTGADGLKRSLALVHKQLQAMGDSASIYHHVHDEIILEVDDKDDAVREAQRILHDSMVEGMSHYLKQTPVVVEPSSGYSWAEAK